MHPPSPPQLADFGLSGFADFDGLVASSPGGTLAFMSPEQLCDGPLGPAADVWAVGCLLWMALQRQALWEEVWDVEEHRKAGAVPEPLSAEALARCGAAGAQLQALLEGCLRVDAGGRASIREVVLQLGAIVTALEQDAL